MLDFFLFGESTHWGFEMLSSEVATQSIPRMKISQSLSYLLILYKKEKYLNLEFVHPFLYKFYLQNKPISSHFFYVSIFLIVNNKGI